MMLQRRCILLGLALATAAPAVRGQGPAAAPAPVAEEELLAELAGAPLDNVGRVEALKALYEQAGAPAEAIALQPVEPSRPGDPLLHNVIVTKPGMTGEVIVVGGHLDKVPVGRGLIDDWSGASMAANLYQAIRDVPTRHTFVFLGFAFEEQGLLGSRRYVESLGEEGRAALRAMVNLECLGVDGPFLWTNGSTDALEAIAHRIAEGAGLPLLDHVIPGVTSDSVPFARAGVPTITFDGLPADRFDLIHSERDRFENVDPETFATTYSVVLRFLLELDAALALGELEDDPAPPIGSDRSETEPSPR